MNDPEQSNAALKQTYADSDFRAIWRMKRGDAVLVVSIRTHSSTCTEIFLLEQRAGLAPTVSREAFDDTALCQQWLMTKKEQLHAQGWRNDDGG